MADEYSVVQGGVEVTDEVTATNKSLDEQIKTLQKYIKDAKKDLSQSEQDINKQSYKFLKAVPEFSAVTVNGIVKDAIVAYNPVTSLSEQTVRRANITQWLSQEPRLINVIEACKTYAQSQGEISQFEAEIADLQSQKLSPAPQSTYQEQDVPDGEGHLYPVALVTGWTNQLNYYNAMLDEFMAQLDSLEIDIDVTWICKKCEWLCRKINYGLALLRYEIIKGLNKMYQQAQSFLPLISAVTQVSLGNLGSVCSWGSNVIRLLLGPYITIVMFISDFFSYTPKLVSAAGKLVGTAAKVPGKVLGRINLVAEDADGNKKELTEVYKQYINIKMEPITLGDVMSGPGAKPQMAEYSVNKQQYAMMKSKVNEAQTGIDGWWTQFQQRIRQAYNESLPEISVQWPAKIDFIAKDNFSYYFIGGSTNNKLDQYETAKIVYEMAKEKERAEKAKAEAIKKAQKAQKLAERNDALAGKDILNNDAVLEAHYAQQEAEEALRQAEKISTEVEIPWGTHFNTSRYPVYPFVTTYELTWEIVNEYSSKYGSTALSGLRDSLIMYYKNAYGKKCNTKILAKTVKYVSFLDEFKSVYPFIPEELEKLKNLVIQYDTSVNDMNDLNKRSVFK